MLPRIAFRWAAERRWQTEMYVGVSSRAYRLPLDLLAVADLNAATAEIYRWDATAGNPSLALRGPLVARVRVHPDRLEP